MNTLLAAHRTWDSFVTSGSDVSLCHIFRWCNNDLSAVACTHGSFCQRRWPCASQLKRVRMHVLVKKRHTHAHVHGERACIRKCECKCLCNIGRVCMLLAHVCRRHDVEIMHVEDRLESMKLRQLGTATICRMRCYPKGCAAPSNVQG